MEAKPNVNISYVVKESTNKGEVLLNEKGT
jgi:hypothetical protein